MTTVRLRSHYFDAGKVDLYHLCGGEYVLRRLTSELRIHGTDDRAWKIQTELEATLSRKHPNQLVTWALLEPNTSSSFTQIFQESREKNMIYKASFTLDSLSIEPVTSRIFTPHYLFSILYHTQALSPLLDFFQQIFSQAVLSEKHCPLVVMFIYRVSSTLPPKTEPLPVLRCGNDSGKFLAEIGLAQYIFLMHQRGYTDIYRIIFDMSRKERGKMFDDCRFSSNDRAHFVGICAEYADQLGRPIDEIY